jgi:hypothetical protein
MYFYLSNIEIEGQEFFPLHGKIKLLVVEICDLTYGIMQFVERVCEL